MSETIISVPGRFNPIEADTPLAHASDIYDSTKEQTVQETLNGASNKFALQEEKLNLLTEVGTLVNNEQGIVLQEYSVGDIFYVAESFKDLETRRYYVAIANGSRGDIVTDVSKFVDAGTSSVNALNIKTSRIKSDIQGDDAYEVYVKQWQLDHPSLQPTPANGLLDRNQWLASLVGKTAYDIAVENDFEGTEAAWLQSLKGKSALEIYNELHSEDTPITEEQFIEKLKASYPMKYVGYDSTAASADIGDYFDELDNKTASSDYEFAFYCMPDTDPSSTTPTNTFVYICVNTGSDEYKWTKLTQLSVPNNVLTEDNVDDSNLGNPQYGSVAKAIDLLPLKLSLDSLTEIHNVSINTNTDFIQGYVKGTDGSLPTGANASSRYYECNIPAGYDYVRFLGWKSASSSQNYGAALIHYEDNSLVCDYAVRFSAQPASKNPATYMIALKDYPNAKTFRTTIKFSNNVPSSSIDNIFFVQFIKGDKLIDRLNTITGNITELESDISDVNTSIPEKIAEKSVSEVTMPFDANNVAEYITDNVGTVIGFIDTTGKLHITNLSVEHLELGDGGLATGVPSYILPYLTVASKNIGRVAVTDESYAKISNRKGEFSQEGLGIKQEPTISIIDDDAIDYQIAVSYDQNKTNDSDPDTSYAESAGGYASILIPLLLAFNAKYGTNIKVGIAAEGQRIGFTTLRKASDAIDLENSNGLILKKCVQNGIAEAICHSMTTKYNTKNYIVESLTSEFAQFILANGTYSENGAYDNSTTTCYCEADGKNYHVNSAKTSWVELQPQHIKPYCLISATFNGTTKRNENEAYSELTNSAIIINPTYSVKYQIDEWFKRANIFGLDYCLKKVDKRAYVSWGSSPSIWSTREAMKYAEYPIGQLNTTGNKVPFGTVLVRTAWSPAWPSTDEYYSNASAAQKENFNIYTSNEYNRVKAIIDYCKEHSTWLILRQHFNEYQFKNFYNNWAKSFGEGEINLYNHFNDTVANATAAGTLNYYDADYNPEWCVPLKWDELKDLRDGVADYLTTPPARLGIESWDEWYPCPGTGCAMFWDLLKYALDQGVLFSSIEDGFIKYGNLLTIGFKGDAFDNDENIHDAVRNDTSYCVVGADGSIDYKSL